MEPGLEIAEPCSLHRQRGRQSSFRCLVGWLCSHLCFLGSPVASFLGAALNQTESAWVFSCAGKQLRSKLFPILPSPGQQ